MNALQAVTRELNGPCGYTETRLLRATDNIRSKLGVDGWWSARLAIVRAIDSDSLCAGVRLTPAQAAATWRSARSAVRM